MGKRRDSSWLTTNYGGMPGWAVLATSVVVVACAIVVALNIPKYASAFGDHTPRPFPTFTAESPAPEATNVLFVGDSYSAGAGASTEATRWTSVAANALDWNETNVALGGTGYLTTSSQAGCGLDFCAAYPERIEETTNVNPDFVIISGGRNDSVGGDEFRPAVERTLDAARTKYPNATVVITSPIWDADAAPNGLNARRDAAQSVAEERGIRYIDLGEPLAGKYDFITSDGIHPNDQGHAAIAAAFVAAWPQS